MDWLGIDAFSCCSSSQHQRAVAMTPAMAPKYGGAAGCCERRVDARHPAAARRWDSAADCPSPHSPAARTAPQYLPTSGPSSPAWSSRSRAWSPPRRAAPPSDPGAAGVGIVFFLKEYSDGSSEMVVEELTPFGAAFDLQDQIKKGDVLVTVDGVEVKNMEPSQLGKLILGPVGSTAELVFSREETGNFEFIRKEPETPSGNYIDDDIPLISMQDGSDVFVKGDSAQEMHSQVHITCKILRRHNTAGSSHLGATPATPPYARSQLNLDRIPLASYA
eukprot:Tamp_27757.p1 GENE.Tamp_27757~~Tamp_27757.p1  ORF type:complete len:276 (-),score=34.35 Tamp_27757:15-842(-)